jgi:putative endonuclease
MMPDLCLYIVRCSDGTYYTGVTNDLTRRVAEHNQGVDTKSYTYSRRPVEIAFSEAFASPRDAIQAEKQIKGWTRRKKEALIDGRFDLLHELARCLNETSHTNNRKKQH